jgi:hypothetical protein
MVRVMLAIPPTYGHSFGPRMRRLHVRVKAACNIVTGPQKPSLSRTTMAVTRPGASTRLTMSTLFTPLGTP